jgi:2-iminobutanoate/2-iminopropanoate deaminase
MAELVPVATPDAPTPTGPFNQAIRIGHRVYTSGQAGRNRDTGQMGGVAEQVDWALRNLDEIAKAGGTSLRRAIKLTMILRDDVNDMAPVNAAYTKHFGGVLPARSSLLVSRLKNADKLVENEAVADVS